jgi:hypothetical protein
MTAEAIIELCRAKRIELKADGDRLRFRPANIPDDLRQALTTHKAAILAELAPRPTGCAWREDEQGRLIFSDGSVYSPTECGGWILTAHPGQTMLRPGTLLVQR